MSAGLNRYALVLIWVLLALALAVAVPDKFLQPITFYTIFGTQSVLVVLTLALLMPLAVGDFDLSVANTMGMGATLMVVLNGDKYGLPLPVALVITLIVGLAIGWVNALLVVKVGVNAIVATLGMGTLLLGLANWLSDSIIQTGIDRVMSKAVNDRFIGLPLSFWYGIVLAAALWYVLAFRPLGRRIRFVGENPDMARLTGVRVERLRSMAFVGSSLMSTLAGILLAGQLGAFQASSATSYLLPTFAAAFLGTTVVNPGRFNPWGCIIAIYFLITGVTGLNLLGLTGWVQDAFYGGALIVAVTLSTIVRKRIRRP
ncbi:ABC transporter permease [Arthrobacter sp. B1I2]|uniref:ABC transporter permease n=1 Tax=Arthrobacter sp. B1I2 TaxID=3042263 RepID=UPI0027D84DA3|nr:ABC transporter permease [Arthrobacter sp. B1I2]